jgi:DNA-binding NarL/FixJ family response regulator
MYPRALTGKMSVVSPQDDNGDLMPDLITTSTPNHHPLRVIVADDVPQVRQDLHLLLQLTGEVEVIGEAASGWEAILQAETLHPDVMVIDLLMPDMDGCQVTYAIKAFGLANRVVILSIHAEPEDIERALKAGADAYIQKGADLSVLVKAITDSDQASHRKV